MEATASSTHPSTPDSRRTLRRSLETEAEWPTHEPALSRIVADRDHVWVQSYYRDHPLHIPPPADSVTWSVFRRDGTWLGEVTVPAAFRITFIGDDEVAGLWKTQEGVAEIRVYAVEGRRVR